MPRVRTLTPGASPTHFFGSEVRRAREAAAMPQAELGALVPCDKSVVSRIELGLVQADEPFARACDVAFPHLDGFFLRFWKDCQTWSAAFPPAFRAVETLWLTGQASSPSSSSARKLTSAGHPRLCHFTFKERSHFRYCEAS